MAQIVTLPTSAQNQVMARLLRYAADLCETSSTPTDALMSADVEDMTSTTAKLKVEITYTLPIKDTALLQEFFCSLVKDLG